MANKKIDFSLVSSTDGTFYWTVFLPTQRNKFKTRAEAEDALAEQVNNLRNDKFTIGEFNLNGGKQSDYAGGLPHLLRKFRKPVEEILKDVSRKDNPKTPKGVQKRKGRKPVVSRPAKRNRRKK
jgi:hypothetical protein